jgi:1,4-alpha-glucan branching enzyme
MGHQGTQALGAKLTNEGVEFRVWAPYAQAVSVFVGDTMATTETALANEDGYWSATVADAKPGQIYKYHIQSADGQWHERNDPRARMLTVSDSGDSVIADPNYDWENVSQPVIAKSQQVIYELHIGTFNRPDAATTGTFETAIEKLDYLQNLGITTIELMPVTAMAKSHGWGYAPNHLFSVENTYGGRHGLLDFVKACHRRGMLVVLDVVFNHFFPETDLWQFDGWNENNRGGIYFYNDERGDTPWGGRPDYGRPEVRQFLLDNITMWLTEYRIDGLRLDSTIYMRNTAGQDGDPQHDIPDAWSLFQEMNRLAHKINPNALMIAEDYSVNEYVTKPITEGGAGFDAQWGTGFPLAIRKAFGMESHDYGESLTYALRQTYNGDAFQRVIFGDSHDTAANGWARINEASSPGNASSILARQRSLVADALTLTAPGIPMILQGEEFLQPGDFNDWQMLEWDKTVQFAGIVLAHQHLINLRKDLYANTTGLTGSSINVFHEDIVNTVFGYHRWKNGGPNDDVLVIVNCSDSRIEDYKMYVPLPGVWHVRFNSSWSGYSPDFQQTSISQVTSDENSEISLELSPYNILILAQDPDVNPTAEV